MASAWKNERSTALLGAGQAAYGAAREEHISGEGREEDSTFLDDFEEGDGERVRGG